MGIFTTEKSTKIRLVKLISTDSEVDGVVIEITTQLIDGGLAIGRPMVKIIEIHFDDEIII